jgi:hypothetical protein
MTCAVGPELEAAFLESWDQLVAFYEEDAADPRYPWIRPLLSLIAAMRAAGRLRAGHSLHVMVLSRSRTHGLRVHQPSLGLNPRDNGLLVERELLPYALESRLRALLDDLVLNRIDG